MSFGLLAQSPDCANAEPFCTDEGDYVFPASVDAPAAELGPEYDCLFNQPNPAWYFMQIADSGDIIIDIDANPASDIDFICWGPFNTLTDVCNQLTLAMVVDCSYAGGTATEVCDITGAVAGEFYMLLLTNWSNNATDITFGQSNIGAANAGTTDCSIVDCNSSYTTTDVNCNGDLTGSIDYSVNLANGSTFDWDFTLELGGNIVQTFNNNTTGGVFFSGLAAGTYTVVGTELSGCITTDIIVITEPEALDISFTSNDIDCFGNNNGSISYTVTGGIEPYSYSLNGGSNQNNGDFNNLLSGTQYSCVVTDLNGCQITSDNIILTQPSAIIVSDIIVPASCFGFADGAIAVSASGGAPGFTYNWSSSNTFTDNGASISDLLTGNYTLNLTDANDCPFSNSYFVAENSLLNIDSNTSNYNDFNIRCYDGSDGWISVGISGGMLPYIYSWTNGLGDVISDYSDIHDLRAGDYQLTVTDAEGCPVVLDFALTEPDSLSIDVSNFQHKSCTYNDDGFIEIVTWGGPDTPPGSENFNPFTFRWDGPNFFFSYEEDIYNLENGMYHLTTRDINDCENTLSFEITEPPMVIADYHVMDDTVTINYPYMNIYDNSEGNIVAWDWEISNGFTSSAQDILELNLATNLEEIGIKEYALKLIVTDEFGCSDTTHGTLAIKDEHTLYVPNAFTPDLDMNNDEFIIRYHALQEETFKLDIYDRFGSLVHTSNDPNSSWDGTNDFSGNKLMTGVYTYYISYQDFEGRIYDHTTCENCTGTISLMR